MTGDRIETKKQFLGLERTEWWFWIKWVLASIVGWSLGWFVVRVVGVWAVFGTVFGAIVGVVAKAVFTAEQWVTLRKRVYRSGWWVLVIVACWFVIGVVGGAIGVILFGIVFGAVVGAIVGKRLWGILQMRVYWSGWWVLTTFVGVIIGVFVGSSKGEPIVGTIIGGVGGGVAGVVIGSVLRTEWWSSLRKRIYHSRWWVVPSCVVGVPVMYTLWNMGETIASAVGMGWFVIGEGVVFGAITGFVMIKVLQHPIPEARDPQHKESIDQDSDDV